MKLPNFTRSLHGVGEQNLILFLNLDTFLSDSTPENLANIWQHLKWNWIGSMKFEAAQMHFLSDLCGLLSFRNFATMATWRDDLSSILSSVAAKFFLKIGCLLSCTRRRCVILKKKLFTEGEVNNVEVIAGAGHFANSVSFFFLTEPWIFPMVHLSWESPVKRTTPTYRGKRVIYHGKSVQCNRNCCFRVRKH